MAFIPGRDCSARLETISGWYHDDQRETGKLHAVAWGQRPQATLARAFGVRAGEADWAERVATQLSAFIAPCRWSLDYLTPGRARFLLLAALTVSLGPREVDQVLAEGRALADSLARRLVRQHPIAI